MTKELLKELKELKKESKEYLEKFLKENEEAQMHYPTIQDYDNCVSEFYDKDDAFYFRIYDLAIYNLTTRLLNKYINK
jgi:thiamine kinase-like enzyme